VAAAAEDKPVKRTRTRKTAQAPAAEAKAEQAEKPVKRARKAATTPIFSAPE